MKKILTIIVPSYNTEKYMDECLPTILNAQSIDDIEVLLINDGSKDHTADKALIYQEKYPNSVRLISKENGGHGSVINRGIEEASGKYFKVIDGDDWVKTKALDNLVEQLKKSDADLVINPMYVHNIVNGEEHLSVPTKENKYYGEKKDFSLICSILDTLLIHNITYRTALLRENNIKVQEHCYYEDKEYDIYPLQYVQSALLLKFPVYVYRVGAASQSVSKTNLLKNKGMHYHILSNLIRFYYSLQINDSAVKSFINKSIKQMMISNYGLFYRLEYGNESRKLLREFDAELKEDFPQYYQESEDITMKILRNFSWPVYTAIYIMYNKRIKKRGY